MFSIIVKRVEHGWVEFYCFIGTGHWQCKWYLRGDIHRLRNRYVFIVAYHSLDLNCILSSF